MKKTLALVLALAMVFSTITVAFADETAAIGADAQVCADLGMLKGATGTVDASYLATTPTRLQAAIMFLRLKGLEAEATAFTGTENFADADKVAWAEGKNILAYLKAHPELGWKGDGTNFDPNSAVTAKQYYKVLLEALGYKQNTAEVVGDFTWENVVEFAAGKGLTKVAAVEAFTVNDLAAATVEALKANVKEGEKTLVASLVEAGKVDAAKAEAAGLYTNATTTTDAALKGVKAIGNTAVEVEFTAAVEKAYAENVANYAVVEKGTTTALEVKAAVLDGTKKVVLETAAQSSGKAYTLTVGAVAKNFGGVAKNTGAPELDKVEGTDTERVELTFTKIMDLATALDVNNYAIAGVTIESAAWADSSRKIVELTTKGMVANKTYKVTVTNVKSVDFVNLKSASKSFLSKSDKKVPDATITKAKCTNTRIIVQYNEVVEKESAENLANYKLTVGSSNDNVLEITAAKLVEDDNDDETIVELTTAPQKSGQKYVLHITGVADTSVLANVITKEKKLDYYGTRVDTTKPTVAKVDYLTDSLIQVEYTETSRLDSASALDINNYSVNNDVTVEKVEFKDADDADCKIVRLTVSELGEKSSYQIVIKDIADEYGNVMGEKKFTRTFNKATVNTPATVQKVVSSGKTTVKVYFTKEVDSATAKDVANYSINNDIGTPIKTSLSDDSKVITLTTEEMTANKEYKVTVNGVKDLADNTITSVTVKFVVSATANDLDAPEIDDLVAVNDRVIRVTFNEVIDVEKVPTIVVNDGSDKTATYKVSTDDDDMVLEFRLTDGNAFGSEEDVTFKSTTAKDLAGNKCTDKDIVFSSTEEDPENPELLSWEQVSVKKFQLTFAEKINKTLADGAFTPAGGDVVPYGLTIEVDEDDNTIVYLKSTQKMDTEEEFKIDFRGVLQNYHGIDIEQDENNQIVFETNLEDEDAPYIENVEATAKDEVVVTFNEEMGTTGSWKINYTDDDGKEQSITGLSYELTDDAELTITITGSKKLDAKYIYTLAVGASRAQDVAYNKIDAEAAFDFAGTNVVSVGNYITGIKILNGSTLEVRTFAAVDPDAYTFTIVYGNNGSTTVNSSVREQTPGDDAATKVLTFDLNVYGYDLLPTDGADDIELPYAAFQDGVTYTVKLDTTGTDNDYSYDFDGTVEPEVSIEKVGSDYKVTYADAAENEYVQIIGNGQALEEVDAEGFATFATNNAVFDGETKVTIMVVRDLEDDGTGYLYNGVVLFYAVDVELP